MATIKGIWKFNETVTLERIDQDVNYSCGSLTGQTSISVIKTDTDARIMIKPSYTNVYDAETGWWGSSYRNFDFGETGQEVSDEFATWVFQNASGGTVTFPATDGRNTMVVVQGNGSISLATAGTYCETDIDVEVAVESSGGDSDAYKTQLAGLLDGTVTEITVPAGVTQIRNNAFADCPDLTVINVPWAEGAVVNAPWGATNATINYNYTGE